MGTVSKPIALDTYENLYKTLDDEFFRLLGLYSWFKSGLLNVDIADFEYKTALSLKYLIDYNKIQELKAVYGKF